MSRQTAADKRKRAAIKAGRRLLGRPVKKSMRHWIRTVLKDHHNADTASARAAELIPGAFCVEDMEEPVAERFRVLLPWEGKTLLCAASSSWALALEAFWHWHNNNPEKGSAASAHVGVNTGNGGSGNQEATSV